MADGSLTEQDFCLGDIVDVGTATLQVSQPRIPCFKQADQLKVADLLAIVVREGRTGRYFRVLKECVLAAGDVLRWRERPYPQWTIERLNQFIRFPKDPAAWRELAQYPELAIDLRRRAEEWERS
ncbi:MAG: MOSC domain-containing protein [Firmicutes bacterium]|nr:MOSC domain-containing protein [Bacillota bacterium]